MKIQILSDLHLEQGVPSFLNSFEPVGDVLVLAGDITSARAKGRLDEVFGKVNIPIIYVLGNHEYYGGLETRLELDRYKDWVADMPQFHILDGNVHPVEVNGDKVYFIGSTYWSDVSPIEEMDVRRVIADFRMIQNRSIDMHNGSHKIMKDLIPFLAEAIRAKEPDAKIVVVTHFPPSYQAQEERFKGGGSAISSYFYNNDELMVERVNPKLWIYGHTHGNLRFNIGDVPVVTNQLGYWQGSFDGMRVEPCYKDFDRNYVVEI